MQCQDIRPSLKSLPILYTLHYLQPDKNNVLHWEECAIWDAVVSKYIPWQCLRETDPHSAADSQVTWSERLMAPGQLLLHGAAWGSVTATPLWTPMTRGKPSTINTHGFTRLQTTTLALTVWDSVSIRQSSGPLEAAEWICTSCFVSDHYLKTGMPLALSSPVGWSIKSSSIGKFVKVTDSFP